MESISSNEKNHKLKLHNRQQIDLYQAVSTYLNIRDLLDLQNIKRRPFQSQRNDHT